MNNRNSYTIEIENETGFELTQLMLTMSYPIKISNGPKENPFVIEGKTVNTVKPITLKSGESIQFSIDAPIKEVFSDNDLLDFENPYVELKGFVKEENSEIPFGISGGFNVLANSK